MLREVDLHREFSSVLMDFLFGFCKMKSFVLILARYFTCLYFLFHDLGKYMKNPLIASFLFSLQIKQSANSSFCKRWLQKAYNG